MIFAVFVALVAAYYAVALIASVRGHGRGAATDRLRLLTTTLEATLLLLILWIVIPWSPATGWVWAVLVSGLFALAALAVLRAAELPWISAETKWARLRAFLTPLYAALLAALCGLIVSTLV